MTHVREVVTDMARDGAIEVTLRGELIDVEEVDLESIRGPLRIRLAPKPSDSH
jgi:hypothetical protein